MLPIGWRNNTFMKMIDRTPYLDPHSGVAEVPDDVTGDRWGLRGSHAPLRAQGAGSGEGSQPQGRDEIHADPRKAARGSGGIWWASNVRDEGWRIYRSMTSFSNLSVITWCACVCVSARARFMLRNTVIREVVEFCPDSNTCCAAAYTVLILYSCAFPR